MVEDGVADVAAAVGSVSVLPPAIAVANAVRCVRTWVRAARVSASSVTAAAALFAVVGVVAPDVPVALGVVLSGPRSALSDLSMAATSLPQVAPVFAFALRFACPVALALSVAAVIALEGGDSALDLGDVVLGLRRKCGGLDLVERGARLAQVLLRTGLRVSGGTLR